jgi:hypothetical protein
MLLVTWSVSDGIDQFLVYNGVWHYQPNALTENDDWILSLSFWECQLHGSRYWKRSFFVDKARALKQKKVFKIYLSIWIYNLQLL